VNDEITILRETGCYADFTFPSAPSDTQPRKINSIYYAIDDPQRPCSHEHGGVDVGVAPQPPESLMLIQGPLVLDWHRRKLGILPSVENGCIQANQAQHIDRLPAWLAAGVRVPRRPDWFFVKLHTHGIPEGNREVLLGEPGQAFHRALAAKASQDVSFKYHYVTAREMYNLVRAAEAGWTGDVAGALDYELLPGEGIASGAATGSTQSLPAFAVKG
jgi:hypothetical protein